MAGGNGKLKPGARTHKTIVKPSSPSPILKDKPLLQSAEQEFDALVQDRHIGKLEPVLVDNLRKCRGQGDRADKKLNAVMKLALLKWYAIGYSTTEVQHFLKELCQVEISVPVLLYYKDRYRQKIATMRVEVFGDDFANIPIAHKEVRLNRLEAAYHYYMSKDRVDEALDILERARIEIEGKTPTIQTGSIVDNSRKVGINVNLNSEQQRTIDRILIEAAERANEGQSGAVVATA